MSSYYLKLYLWQYFEPVFELYSSREYLCLLLLSSWIYNQLKTTLKDWLRSFAWSSQPVWILVPRLYENQLLGNISEGRYFQLFRGLKWNCVLVFHLLVGHFFFFSSSFRMQPLEFLNFNECFIFYPSPTYHRPKFLFRSLGWAIKCKICSKHSHLSHSPPGYSYCICLLLWFFVSSSFLVLKDSVLNYDNVYFKRH